MKEGLTASVIVVLHPTTVISTILVVIVIVMQYPTSTIRIVFPTIFPTPTSMIVLSRLVQPIPFPAWMLGLPH
jgi:hypothetical protein